MDADGRVTGVKAGKATIATSRVGMHPNAMTRVGWCYEPSMYLASNIRVYLNAVKYGDDTYQYFPEDTLVGWFS